MIKFRIEYIDMSTRKKEVTEVICKDHEAACAEARKLSNVYWVTPLERKK